MALCKVGRRVQRMSAKCPYRKRLQKQVMGMIRWMKANKKNVTYGDLPSKKEWMDFQKKAMSAWN